MNSIKDRDERAYRALIAYMQNPGIDNDKSTAAGDLIADLLHFIRNHSGEHHDIVVARACNHVEQECLEEGIIL